MLHHAKSSCKLFVCDVAMMALCGLLPVAAPADVGGYMHAHRLPPKMLAAGAAFTAGNLGWLAFLLTKRDPRKAPQKAA